ncbi:hypothetical protein G5714_021457 [Onychostoma macrolepis]|uniref:Uncharacterized protein n=1 Tax=Onychostoma macrolepis TaxID=369639 RepID=A0A7J6BR07_9TELE|nr:hypothetical protein G5714_021457 [Onychostoma macrolepis]
MSREVSVAQGCNGQLTEDGIPGKDCEDEPESQTLEQQSEQEREDKHQGSDKTRRDQHQQFDNRQEIQYYCCSVRCCIRDMWCWCWSDSLGCSCFFAARSISNQSKGVLMLHMRATESMLSNGKLPTAVF